MKNSQSPPRLKIVRKRKVPTPTRWVRRAELLRANIGPIYIVQMTYAGESRVVRCIPDSISLGGVPTNVRRSFPIGDLREHVFLAPRGWWKTRKPTTRRKQEAAA